MKLLGNWKRTQTQPPPSDGKQRHVLTWSDDQTGLEVTCEATLFSDFPAVEWLLRLRNRGDKDTPILENLRPLDLKIGVGEKESVVFHHAKGSNSQPDDYLTIDADLASANGSRCRRRAPDRRPICRTSTSSGRTADWSGPSAGRANGH